MTGIRRLHWMKMGLTAGLLCITITGKAGPPFNVDDPGTTEFRRFNLLWNYQSASGPQGETLATAFTLGYGLSQNLEFSLGWGGLSTYAQGSGRQTGLSDTMAALKFRFCEESRRSPQFALCYQIKLPTADANRGLGTGRTDHTAWISTGKSFGRTFLFGNVGYNFLGGTAGRNNLFYGIGAQFQATETLVVGGQVYGNTENTPGLPRELGWGAGLIYNFAPDRSFLLQLGRSTQGFSNLNVFAGIQFTFGK